MPSAPGLERGGAAFGPDTLREMLSRPKVAAAGIEFDHEIISGNDLIAKLKAGVTIELPGSYDLVLPGAVAALNNLPVIPQPVTLCTDDILPDQLVARVWPDRRDPPPVPLWP